MKLKMRARRLLVIPIVFSLLFNNAAIVFAQTSSSTFSNASSTDYGKDDFGFPGGENLFSLLDSPSEDDIPSYIRESGGHGGINSPDSGTLSGAFTYDYRLTLPPGRNGMTPDITLSYSNQNHSENDIFGYGWDISIPYIERRNIEGLEDMYAIPSRFYSSFSGELISTSTLSTTTVTLYPDPNPESDTVDGFTYGPTYQHGSGDFSVIRSDPYAFAYDSNTTAFDAVVSDGWIRNNSDGNYDYLGRTYFMFDTSSIPSFAKILSSTFSIYSAGSTTPPWPTTNKYINLNITSVITGSTTAISTDDHAISNFGSTKLSDASVNTADWSSGYKDFILNDPGLAEIKRGGITKFSLRTVPDIDNTNPGMVSNQNVFAKIYFSEQSGTSNDPKLVVNYNADFPEQYVARNDDGSFLQYTFDNNSWIVKDKSGKTYLFGTSTSARVVDPSNSDKVQKWMLQEVIDANGNSITYTYTKDSNQVYPNSISYTGHNGSAGIFSVDFTKSLRATSTATTTAAGFEIKTRYKIDQIQAKVDGEWVRKYDLVYTNGDNGSRLLLNAITETGQAEEGGTLVLPATTFNYSTSTAGWSSVGWSFPTSNFVINSRDQGTKLVDINGDGLGDVVKSFASSTATTTIAYINNGSGWTSNGAWDPPCLFAFTDSDNIPWDGGGRLIDIDGDLLPDFICNNTIHLNTGSGWATSTVWTSPEPITINNKDAGVRFGDLNGDGLIDLIRGYSDDGLSSPIYTKHVYINNGHGWTIDDSWSVPTHFTTLTGGDSGSRLEDVNADGLIDLLPFMSSTSTPNTVMLNTGSGWATSTAWTLPVNVSQAKVRFADFNNDGLVDIGVGAKTGSSWDNNQIYINTGSGWVLNSSWQLPVPFTQNGQDAGTRFGDIDGDGIMDILAQGSGVSGSAWSINQITVGNGNRPDNIKLIDESRGGSITVTYKSSAEYRDGNNNLLNPALPITLDTVQQLQYFNRINSTSTQTFAYEDGSFYYNNAFDRRLAGFGITTKTEENGDKLKTYFHQGNDTNTSLGEYNDDQSKIGRIYRTEKLDSGDDEYSVSVNKWESSDLGGGVNFVRLERSTTLDYDGDSDHKDKSETYTYSTTTGSLTQKIEWGEVTGSVDGSFSDTGSDKRTTDITYAASTTGHLILPSSQTIKNQSDTKITETKFYYDNLSINSASKGNLTKQEMWKTASDYASTTKTYNSYGLITQNTDPRSKNTTYEYDSFNLYPATTTNPLSQSVAYVYDYSSGKPIQTVDANGYVFQTILDALDRVIEEKQPDLSTPSTLRTKVEYDYTDTVMPRVTQKTVHLDASTSNTSYTYYDGFGKKVEERLQAEESNTYTVKDYSYDSRGNLSIESLPFFDSGSAYTGTSSPASTTLLVSYTYDPLQRIISIANVLGTTTNTYDDWKLTVIDANGETKHVYKDAYSRLIRVDEVNDGSTYTTTYEYDGSNNLTKITDAESNARNFTYDGLGRRLTAQDLHDTGDGSYGTWTYSYDDSGNLSSQTDPKSQTTDFTYDDINRVLTENYTGAGGTEVAYGYDWCAGGVGRLCSATTTDVVTKNEYNPIGLVKKETKTISSTDYITQYGFDRVGNLISVIYPDNSEVVYTYNGGNLLEQVEQKESGGSFSDVVSDFDYAPTGKVSYKLFGNGVESTYTYNSAELYRLTNILTTAPGEGEGLGFISGSNLFALYENVETAMSGKFTRLALNTLGRFVLGSSIAQIEEVAQIVNNEIAEEPTVPAGEVEINVTTEENIDPVPVTSEGTLSTTTAEVASTTPESVHELQENQPELSIEEVATTTPSMVEKIVLPVDAEQLKIKTSKEKILGTKEFDGGIVKYAYKTDVKVDELAPSDKTIQEAQVSGLALGSEVKSERTKHARTFATNDPKMFIAEIIPGDPQYYQDEKGEWWLADYGTTTKESYDYQTKEDQSLWERLISFIFKKAIASTGTFYPDADPESNGVDGFTYGPSYSYGSYTFSDIRNHSNAWAYDSLTTAFDGVTSDGWIRVNSEGKYDYLGRAFFLFNTASLPDDAQISSATFSVHGNGVLNSVYADLNLTTVTTASTTSLSSSDHAVANFGSTTLSTSLNTSSWSSGGYNNFSLNSSGIEVINKTGVTSLSLRTVHDINNTNPGMSTNQNIYAGIYFSERTGTSNDPKLIVVYQMPPSAPYGLLTEGQTNPTNVTDATPEFSAIYVDEDAGDIAEYYRIQVATSTAFTSNYWDSNKTALSSTTPAGTRTPEISYAGSSLASSTTYYWRVKFWDQSDAEGSWSTTTASFILEDVPEDPTIQNIYFSYDAVGNITQINDISTTDAYKRTNFGYDDLHRLTSASTTEADSNPFIQTYSYSSIGNMTGLRSNGAATTTYTYAETNYANPHAATAIGGTSLTYDNNGNLLTYGTKSYAWDYRNRMASSSDSITFATTTYKYDHTTNRVQKTTAGTSSYYPNDLYSVEGATSTKYIMVNGEIVATIEGSGGSAETTYIHPDHLGSTNAITDENGDIAQILDYYPYGSERISSGTNETDRHYIGEFYDSESELSYFNARYYEGSRGQFLSQDPVFLGVGVDKRTPTLLLDPQQQNSYNYGRNNPITNKDPNGELAVAAAAPPLIAAGPAGWAVLGAIAIGTTVYLAHEYIDPSTFQTGMLQDSRPYMSFPAPQDPNDLKPPRDGLSTLGKIIYTSIAGGLVFDALCDQTSICQKVIQKVISGNNVNTSGLQQNSNPNVNTTSQSRNTGPTNSNVNSNSVSNSSRSAAFSSASNSLSAASAAISKGDFAGASRHLNNATRALSGVR